MNKSIGLLSALLLIELSLEGWGGSYRNALQMESEQKQSAVQNFPHCPDQGWFIDPNYLLWKPFVGNLEYGVKTKGADEPNGNLSATVRVKKPSYDWNSGVRVGIGRYLPHHDAWDISAYMTYVYADTDSKIHADVNQNQTFNVAYSFWQAVSVDTTYASWRANYFVWDLMLGREFQMSSRMVFHPYIGLRGALINQIIRINASGFEMEPPGSGFDFNLGQTISFSNHDDFWALGLRAGTDFQFSLSHQWMLLGNIAGALLYGHDEVKWKTNSVQNYIGFPTQTIINGVKLKNKDDSLRTNLEGSIGLGWERWFSNDTVRVAPALLYEGSMWFNMNQVVDEFIELAQTRGNLGFIGLSFRLQVDF